MNSNNLKEAAVSSPESEPIPPESIAATQILNGLPQIVEKLSQEEYDSLHDQIANRVSEIFRQGFTQGFAVGYPAGQQYGAAFAMEYCTKNIKGMVQQEAINQGFDRTTALQALNQSPMDK